MKNLSPLAKLAVTAIYIFTTVSFSKYDVTGLVPMFLYPVIMFQLSGLSFKKCFKATGFVMPLIIMTGILNPFIDKVPFEAAGLFTIRAGFVSLFTLILKGLLCLSASYAFAETTKIDELCGTLRRIKIPKIIVTVLLLTWRFIFVMKDEVAVMLEAYHLRAPNQKGLHYSAWGSFLGQLFLRSFDRADDLYSAMILRGYNGNYFYACSRGKHSAIKSWIFFLTVTALILTFRFFNIPEIIGTLFTHILGALLYDFVF
ncbi:MAG: cobalt ECF transporter T component CbiQ [Treponema sp.]|nr:cobalt ECF transporter T component CbiQ [Treponema sp.]